MATVLARVQGLGCKADVVPTPRKLHPNGVTGPTSFTELADSSCEGSHGRDG